MFEGEEIHLRDYFRVIRRRSWLVFMIMLTVVGAVTVSLYKKTPIYRATARIIIEREAPNIVSFKEVLPSNEIDTYQQSDQTQSKMLKSYSLAEQVIQKLQLAEQMTQKPPQSIRTFIRQFLAQIQTDVQEWLGVPKVPKSELAEAAEKQERMINNFLNMITVTPIRNSRLVDVSVDTPDQVQAAQIANTLVDLYIQQHLETKLAASKNAVNWLNTEVEAAKKKVTESEAALQKYKEDNEILSLEGRQNIVVQKLLELNTAVSQAKVRRMTLETQYAQVQNLQKGGLESVPQVINNPLIQQLKVKLLTLEGERSELLEQFRSKHPTVEAVESRIAAIQAQLEVEIHQIVTSMRNEYELARTQENELLTALEQQKAEAQELNQKSIEYGVLEREVESNQRMYESLLQRTKETSLTERLETSNIRIVERATIPTSPIAPQKKRNILLSIIVGLIMGITMVFLLEYLDNSIQTPADVQQYLDLPCLAAIPNVSVKHLAPHEQKPVQDILVATITVVDARSNIAEAYRSLRTNVTFAALDQRPIFLITSAIPGEGKSTITANLGITMAQSGRKTLIIDCDFRKPILNQIFHVKNPEYGFSDILVGSETDDGIGNAVQRTDIQNLYIIPCGTVPPNPSELLSLEKTGRIIAKLAEQYEKILIDSPPIGVVTDPVVLSQLVQGVILVILTGKTSRDAIRHAKDQLHEARAKILGGVLNNVNMKKYGYYYYYGYRDKYYKRYYGEKGGSDTR
jgi:succinoglycan biosynthesis transport protein ExoP